MSDAGTPALTTLCIRNPYVADTAAFIGEIARPFGLISMFTAIFWGFLHKADATALGIMVTGAVALYGGKAAEKIVQARADADVKKTQAVAENK
jgi:hypothetical protein